MKWFIEYEGGQSYWWNRTFPDIGSVIMCDWRVISACSKAHDPFVMITKRITREEAEEMWPIH